MVALGVLGDNMLYKSTYLFTHTPRWFTWSVTVGWRPHGALPAFIKWTGWTLARACHDDSTINIILVIIIRPHRSTTYKWCCLYCYRPSSVVCRLTHTLQNGWTDRVAFGLRTPVDPRNHILDGSLYPPWEEQRISGPISGRSTRLYFNWLVLKQSKMLYR